MTTDFTTVTETPGINVTQHELSHIYTRYHWARQFVRDKAVLEVACGSGQGLGYLLTHGATTITGSDIEEQNLAHARRTYLDTANIQLDVGDATSLHYDDEAFDIVINFEAIYYMEDLQQAFKEAHRLLRPSGKLLISTVNSEWHGFNPSPFSHTYPSTSELLAIMTEAGFQTQIFTGFYDKPASTIKKVISAVRSLASKLGLIPKTMKGKEFLKRIFYGKLTPMPTILADENQQAEKLIPVDQVADRSHYTFLYALGEKSQ